MLFAKCSTSCHAPGTACGSDAQQLRKDEEVQGGVGGRDDVRDQDDEDDVDAIVAEDDVWAVRRAVVVD